MLLDLETILKNEPKYRLAQIEKAWFDLNLNGYDEITTLPLELRNKLKELPWLSVDLEIVQTSKVDSTIKALLRLNDGNLIETVLLGRENTKLTREAEERFTICISSQVGCPMGCVCCATGKRGFKRNLTAEEIVDQFRFWQKYLQEAGETPAISNIVVMGQGEPLLNYENLKKSLNNIIQYGEVGPTKITISTCGVPNVMDQILADKDFPQIRLAVSLHSAVEETRKKIMPSHQKDFLKFLVDWSNRYHKLIPSRTHFIGLEYLMLEGINNDEKQLKALEKLARRIPRVRINLIPYNETRNTNHESLNTKHVTQNKTTKSDQVLSRSSQETIEYWHDYLMKAGFICTIRHSQGQDIAAACGQLANLAITD